MNIEDMPKNRRLWVLFYEFFKIALFVVGGGYAILLVAQDVFVKKHKWLRDGELTDMLTIIQTVPGLTAGNIAIYVGYRVAGMSGALLSLLGVALPSFIVITIVAMGFDAIPINHWAVQGAFLGVRTAMTGLTLVTLIQLWRKSMKDWIQYTLFAITFISIMLFHVNPGWLIFAGLGFGALYCSVICKELPLAAYDNEEIKK